VWNNIQEALTLLLTGWQHSTGVAGDSVLCVVGNLYSWCVTSVLEVTAMDN
jgi:hypothetical protein